MGEKGEGEEEVQTPVTKSVSRGVRIAGNMVINSTMTLSSGRWLPDLSW